MRGRVARKAFAIGSASLVVLGIAGCQQQSEPSEGGEAPADLKIVEQVQIDENGTEVNRPRVLTPPIPPATARRSARRCPWRWRARSTGPTPQLGINIKNGIQLAVDKHNAANPGCQVQLKTFDTEGDPQKATQVAPQIINDAFTIGLIGPAFSGETNATGDVFNQAGLVAATASATNVTLSEKGWKTFFRGLANDGVQGPSVANYLKNTLGLQEGLRGRRQHRLRSRPRPGGARNARPGRRFGVQHLGEEGRQGLLRRGDPDQGRQPRLGVLQPATTPRRHRSSQQLKDGGFEGTFVSADGTKDPEFVKQAGEASKDAILSCPCGPATGTFAEEYTKAFNQEPGTYSAEGYDLGTIMLKGIDSGTITRPDAAGVRAQLRRSGRGRKYQWTPTGRADHHLDLDLQGPVGS